MGPLHVVGTLRPVSFVLEDYPFKGSVRLQMPHHVQKVKFVDYLLGAQPNLQELPELVEAQFEGLVLEALMELPRLPRFGLKHKVLLNQGLYLLLGGYLGDVFPNIDKRTVELELIIEEL